MIKSLGKGSVFMALSVIIINFVTKVELLLISDGAANLLYFNSYIYTFNHSNPETLALTSHRIIRFTRHFYHDQIYSLSQSVTV